MDCSGIKEKLSAYIDDQLVPAEKETVDHHLSTCQECRAALHDLRKTIEYARGVEEIEPPAWLAQKVMARVREESEKKGILRKLFYPLHIKIPAEIFATIAIAAITVFVFKAIQPVMKQAKIPLTEVAAPGEGKEEKTAAQHERPASRETASHSAKRPLEEVEGEKAAVPAAKATIDKMVSRKFSSDMKEQRERGAIALEPSGISKQTAEGMTLIVHVTDIESSQDTVEKSVKALGGSILETEHRRDSSDYVIEIDSRRTKELQNKLSRLGKVLTKGTDHETPGLVIMRIELMER
jgi:hypothetical protein